MLKGIWFGWRVKRMGCAFRGLQQGWQLTWQKLELRKPVSINCFKLYRQLKKHQAISLEQIQINLQQLSAN